MPTPPQPWWRTFTREHWFVFAVASLAWLFDCLDQQIFNLARDGAMEALIPDKKLATEYGPYTTSVFLVGWAIGGLIFGALGDRYGRAKMLTWTIVLYSVSTGLSSFSTGMADFCAYRFITGLGVGGVFGLAVALVADSVPDRARARRRSACSSPSPRGATCSPGSPAWASACWQRSICCRSVSGTGRRCSSWARCRRSFACS